MVETTKTETSNSIVEAPEVEEGLHKEETIIISLGVEEAVIISKIATKASMLLKNLNNRHP